MGVVSYWNDNPFSKALLKLGKGKKPASTCETLLAPGASPAAGKRPASRTQNRNEPLSISRLAVAAYHCRLAAMLARMESELPMGRPEEQRRLETRARLIHELLAPRPVT
jgi:hypothetical protein